MANHSFRFVVLKDLMDPWGLSIDYEISFKASSWLLTITMSYLKVPLNKELLYPENHKMLNMRELSKKCCFFLLKFPLWNGNNQQTSIISSAKVPCDHYKNHFFWQWFISLHISVISHFLYKREKYYVSWMSCKYLWSALLCYRMMHYDWCVARRQETRDMFEFLFTQVWRLLLRRRVM